MSFPGHQDWHTESKLYYTLTDIHAKHGKGEEDLDKKTKAHFNSLLNTLEKHLKQKDSVLKMTRLEFTGSSYEKLKVNSTVMEFDIMVVLAGGGDLDKDEFFPRKPGFVKLRPKPNMETKFSKIRDASTGYLSASKAQGTFRGIVDKLRGHEDFQRLGITRQPKEHGPAIQLDIDYGSLEYSVDLVLAFETNHPYHGRELFVAKRFRDEGNPEAEENTYTNAWRQSFSMLEKDKLTKIDSDQGCRRMCARIFKVFRDDEVVLTPIFSYLIKTLVLHLNDKYGSSFWAKQNLAKCYMVFMWEMAEFLDSGKMEHFFIQEINLFDGMSDHYMKNASSRLRRLVRYEKQFYDKIDRIRGEGQPLNVNGSLLRPVSTDLDLDDFRFHGSSYSEPTTRPSGLSLKREEEGNGATAAGLVAGAALVGLGAFALMKLFSPSEEEEDKKTKKTSRY